MDSEQVTLANGVAPKRVAVLFGINYIATPELRLNGCANDVRKMEHVLRTMLGFSEVSAYDDCTDDGRKKTTRAAILDELRNLARRSHDEPIELAWVHYSGHGTSVPDLDGDESDAMDEALVPSDVDREGIILDDDLHDIIASFNHKTKVVVIVDACHSGTACDLRYSWDVEGNMRTESARDGIAARVLAISGCLDAQVSADAAIVDQQGCVQPIGAMTACLIAALTEDTHAACTNVLGLVKRTQALLRATGFAQVPLLTSNYDVALDPRLIA